MSYIVAIHDISDPDRFWAGAADAVPKLPLEVALHATYPQQDGTRAVCLWEADSVDVVRDLIDGAVGDSSSNRFFAVDPTHPFALGLPKQVGTAG